MRQNSAPLTLIDVAPVGVPFLNLYNGLVAPGLGIAAPNGVSTVNASWRTADIDQTWAGGPSVNDLDARGASLTVDWDLGAVAVKSITAYRELEALFARDGDNTPFTFRETINDDDQDQFSQELQLAGTSFDDRLTWLARRLLLRRKRAGGGQGESGTRDVCSARSIDAASRERPGAGCPVPTPAR